MDYYTQTLAPKTKSVLDEIKDLDEIKNFYLSGGTALALHLGHRESEDLDFFIRNSFEPIFLQEKLAKLSHLEDVEIAEGTLNLFFKGVKLQFLHYPYDLVEPPISWNGIYLSSVVDIACTKLITVLMRGSKKDFIDLYVILQQTSLEELFTKLAVKYKKVDYNMPSILKSLVYFENAENQPMPKMHIPLDWESVKVFFIQKVKNVSFN